MYNVSKRLTSAYGAELEPKPVGPIMPSVTGETRRMTNVKLSNGECIQGIRRNDESDLRGNKENQLCGEDGGRNFKPLRYTPGLKCDAHLESLRPERSNHHQAFTGPEQYGWRKKLIQPQETYEGSFADADLEKFRPEPKKTVGSDPWYTSRVPDPEYFPVNERLAGHQMGNLPAVAPGPYEQVYPQDELSRIKMRNRRFQNSMSGGAPAPPPPEVDPAMMMVAPGYPSVPTHPMMISPQAYYGGFCPPMGYPMGYPPMGMMAPPPPPPMMMPQPQAPSEEGPSPLDDLKVLDQELNVTRRVTRPFIPTDSPEYQGLKKQRDFMEEPLMPIPVQKPKSAVELCPTSVDQLPKPKRSPKAPKKGTEEDAIAAARQNRKQDVRIADQIAIRSMVLGKNLPSVGGSGAAGSGVVSPGSRKGARSSSLPSSGPALSIASPEMAPASPIQQEEE